MEYGWVFLLLRCTEGVGYWVVGIYAPLFKEVPQCIACKLIDVIGTMGFEFPFALSLCIW